MDGVIIKDNRNKTRLKENAIFDILVSEKSYVKQLSIVINFFMKPTKERKLLNSTDFDIVFGNVQTIYSLNEKLLQELYKGSLNVSNAFMEFAPFFKLYSSYAMNFKKILEFLENVRDSNPKFYKFMDDQETRPEVQSRLSSLLIAPIQRIPRYKLLLQNLVDLTLSTDKDYDSLLNSLDEVEAAADHINKVVENQENAQRLLEVQRYLKNGTPAIIAPGRILLRDGILMQSSETKCDQMIYVILTSDVILFCKYTKKPITVNSLKCNCIFPLIKCEIENLEDEGAFQIVCQDEKVRLYDRSSSDTNKWLKTITQAINKCVANRKTLRKESSARRPVKRKDVNEYNEIGLSPGQPLKKRRITIEEEIKSPYFEISRRRTLRSVTPSLGRTVGYTTALPVSLDAKFQTIHSWEDEVTKTIRNGDNIDPETRSNGVREELFVFGDANQNRGFLFKFGSLLTSIGSSVVNLFRDRRVNV